MRGRPHTDTPQRLRQIRATDDLWEWVVAQAQEANLSASEYVRRLIEAERLRRAG